MASSKTAEAREKLAQLQTLADMSEDEKIREIRKLERKLASANAAKKDAEKKYKQAEADLQVSEDNCERLLASQDQATLRKLERSRKRKGRGKASAIICVNDWHLEEVVDPKMVNGVNEFNERVANRRIATTWQKSLYLLDFARSIANINEVVLWAGGDMITGYIHEELMEGNRKGPAEASIEVQNHLIQGIDLLKRESKADHVLFTTSLGNHGRSTKDRRIATEPRSSWEWLIYNNVANFFRDDDKVQCKLEPGYHNILPVQGHTVRFHHGHAIKYGGGIGGVHVPLRRKIAQWNEPPATPAELDVMGHFHQYGCDWNYVLCGCLIGISPYAKRGGFKAQPPTQTFIVIDYEHGMTMSMPIFCDDKPTKS